MKSNVLSSVIKMLARQCYSLMRFYFVGGSPQTLFIHFQVCCRASLGWLWQGAPNVKRWPMLRSQAARPECVWPGWNVPFRPSTASLPLLPSIKSHSEAKKTRRRRRWRDGKISCRVELKSEHSSTNHWPGYTNVWHLQLKNVNTVRHCF